MPRQRLLRIEPLQRRDLMTVESLAWDGASSLRISFVPDGTQVADQVSNLDSTLKNSPSGSAWRESIVQAFQIWSQYAAINVGVVNDNGAPLGTDGAVRGDSRFGEIRVAGIPMTNDTWAAAIDHDKLALGTWAGDLLFNTAANWNTSADNLLRVALHEAGHILGLPHNVDPTSPMHTHGIPTSLTPAATDIALLQQLYGQRAPDANEISKPNDTTNDATRLRFSSDADFDGSRPLVHYGEIRSANDRDVFFFETPSSYRDAVTINVVSSGLSSLSYRVTAKNRAGSVVATGESTARLGGDVELHLPRASGGSKYYFQIDAIGDSLSKVGSYAIIARLDSRIAVNYSDTLSAVRTAHRWFASSAESLVNFDVGQLAATKTSGTLVDDHGTDDNPIDAPRITPYADTSLLRASRTIASISQPGDVDHFRFRSPSPPAAKVFGMLVQIDAIERKALLPIVEVLDKDQRKLPVEILVNGNGEVILWVPRVNADRDYFVRVRSDADHIDTGNYELTAAFQENKPARKLLVDRQLTPALPEAQSVWYLARPQLFSLALDASSQSQSSAPAWVTVYDEHKRPVSTVATRANVFRTGSSVLLLPGTYYLQFGARFTASETQSLRFQLFGDGQIDPLGPKPVAPGTTPIFVCPDIPIEFCYPPDIQSPDPFVIIPDPPVTLPTAGDFPIIVPSSVWFWNEIAPHYNSVQPLDSSNDGAISALDAMLVMNVINLFGAGLLPAPTVALVGMVDTNNDGVVSALDALLIVNYLNTHPNGEQESSFSFQSPDLTYYDGVNDEFRGKRRS